jgi:hypothetical protein
VRVSSEGAWERGRLRVSSRDLRMFEIMRAKVRESSTRGSIISASASESDHWESVRESGWDHLRILENMRVKYMRERGPT